MRSQAGDQNDSLVSVVMVNMSALFRELLCSAFEVDGAVQIVALVTSIAELAEALDQFAPDVALVGALGLAHSGNASLFLQELASRAPHVRSIVIAPAMEREDVVSYLHEGARGLVCASGTGVSVLTKCVRCVADGQVWATAAQLDLLIGSLSSPVSHQVTDVLGEALLSKREEQVLHLLADGMSNRELAAALKLSEHTIKNHLFRIFDKLGVSNRMEAVLYLISQRGQKRTTALPRVGAATKTKIDLDGLRTSNRLQ